MVVFTARIETNTPERRELTQALLDWVKAARNQTGAMGSHVYEDIEAPCVFHVVSQWKDRSSFDGHLCGSDFGIVLGALELLARPPQMMLTEVGDGSRGGDAFSTLRLLRDRVRRAELNDPSGAD